MKKTVTIITPAYNAEAYVLECIESVRRQSTVSVEHIVIDDGSSDRTVEIVESCRDVILIRQANQGAPVARNAGLEVATGKFVKFLDADDLLVDGALQAEVDFAETLSNREVGYGYFEAFDDSSGWTETRSYKFVEAQQAIDLILKTILTSATLYPTEAIRAIGGFDVRLSSSQEWNLNLRLCHAGYGFIESDIFVYRHRFHDSETRITNRKRESMKEMVMLEYTYDVFSRVEDTTIQDAWAARFWNTGRQFLGLDDSEGAQLFFEKAKSISANGHWKYMSQKYRLAAKAFGPVLAEKIFSVLSRLVRPK